MATLMTTLHALYTPNELKRLKFKNKAGLFIVWVDLHGMPCSEAKRFIDNLINISNCPLILAIVHGFKHGTALSHMVRNDIDNKRILTRIVNGHNPGVTYLDISGCAQ